jgi:hypothetical protein
MWKENLFNCPFFCFLLSVFTFSNNKNHCHHKSIIMMNNKVFFFFISGKLLVTHWLLLVGQTKEEKKEIWFLEREREREKIVNASLRSLTCRCFPVDWCPSKKKSNGNCDYVFFYEQCRKRERVIRRKNREKKKK